jgi:hypothetical protein
MSYINYPSLKGSSYMPTTASVLVTSPPPLLVTPPPPITTVIPPLNAPLRVAPIQPQYNIAIPPVLIPYLNNPIPLTATAMCPYCGSTRRPIVFNSGISQALMSIATSVMCPLCCCCCCLPCCLPDMSVYELHCPDCYGVRMDAPVLRNPTVMQAIPPMRPGAPVIQFT